ncbi:NTP transferase domain-containing protein [Kitasatospora indigofera]|uniref:phosphocholine cytidylyltransferase family protein n=1 Tax=Kitasatospora indigofera TaxID=67307 RepID=UPI003664413A
MHTVVVLAAGRGSRLGTATDQRPKPLTPLAGRTLLARLLTAFDAAGLHQVTLVTGYRADDLAAAAPACRTVHNPDWATTGIATSLLAAADAGALDGGAVVTYGDITLEPRVLTTLLTAAPADICLPVNTSWLRLWQQRMPDPLADAERLLLRTDSTLADIGGAPASLDEVNGQFMGVLRLSPAGAAALTDFYRHHLQHTDGADRWDTTALLRAFLADGHQVDTVPVDGGWLETDTPDDHALYERLHVAGHLGELCDLATTEGDPK